MIILSFTGIKPAELVLVYANTDKNASIRVFLFTLNHPDGKSTRATMKVQTKSGHKQG